MKGKISFSIKNRHIIFILDKQGKTEISKGKRKASLGIFE